MGGKRELEAGPCPWGGSTAAEPAEREAGLWLLAARAAAEVGAGACQPPWHGGGNRRGGDAGCVRARRGRWLLLLLLLLLVMPPFTLCAGDKGLGRNHR